MSLSKDSKMQMRENIKQHRLKLFQCLQNVDDNVLKSKIKNIILNDKIKSNIKQNVKQEIASNAKSLKPKLVPVDKITDQKTTSTVKINQSNNQVHVKTNLEEIKQQNYRNENIFIPIPQLEIKSPEDSEPSSILKKLKMQLIEEEENSNSSSDENDEIISVGSNDNCNDIFQPQNENASCSSSIEAVKDKPPVNNESKEKYSYHISNTNNDNDIVIECPNTSKNVAKRQPKNILKKPIFRKTENKGLIKAKERAFRDLLRKNFNLLKNTCSCLKNYKRATSKQSILLAATQECKLLRHFEIKLITEKKLLCKVKKNLMYRLANLRENTTKTTE